MLGLCNKAIINCLRSAPKVPTDVVLTHPVNARDNVVNTPRVKDFMNTPFWSIVNDSWKSANN